VAIEPKEDYITVREAQAYLRDTWQQDWTGVWIRTLAHDGFFRWDKLGKGKTARIRISRQSIDEHCRSRRFSGRRKPD
jgi:hypothetical protein